MNAISIQEWKEIISDKKDISFFETPEWYQIWAEELNGITRAYTLSFNGHDFLLAAIQIKGAKGLVTYYESGPVGTYSTFRNYNDKNIRIPESLLLQHNQISLRLHPLSNISIETKKLIQSNEKTNLIQLAPLHSITEHWSRNHKRMFNTSKNNNLKVEIADSKDEWREYYKIYQSFIAKKQKKASNKYQWNLFKKLYELNPVHRKLWIAKKDGEIIAGRLVFYYSNYVVEWHAAADAQYQHLGANHLLIHDIIDAAKKSGFSWYDFNPSGGNTGVDDFKQKFGGMEFSASMYYRDTILHKGYQLYCKLQRDF